MFIALPCMWRRDKPNDYIRIGHARDSTFDWLNLETAPCRIFYLSSLEAQVWDSAAEQLAVISIASACCSTVHLA